MDIIRCSCCLEAYKPNPDKKTTPVFLPCGHVYHISCALKWYRQNLVPDSFKKILPNSLECPICRKRHLKSEFVSNKVYFDFAPQPLENATGDDPESKDKAIAKLDFKLRRFQSILAIRDAQLEKAYREIAQLKSLQPVAKEKSNRVGNSTAEQSEDDMSSSEG